MKQEKELTLGFRTEVVLSRGMGLVQKERQTINTKGKVTDSTQSSTTISTTTEVTSKGPTNQASTTTNSSTSIQTNTKTTTKSTITTMNKATNNVTKDTRIRNSRERVVWGRCILTTSIRMKDFHRTR